MYSANNARPITCRFARILPCVISK